MFSPKALKESAEYMKKNTSPNEITVGNILVANNISFIHQEIFGFYIFDFFIPSKLLILEVDDSSHDNKATRIYDKRRDYYCKGRGLKVDRLDTREIIRVMLHIDKYKEVKNYKTIYKQIKEEADNEHLRTWLSSRGNLKLNDYHYL